MIWAIIAIIGALLQGIFVTLLLLAKTKNIVVMVYFFLDVTFSFLIAYALSKLLQRVTKENLFAYFLLVLWTVLFIPIAGAVIALVISLILFHIGTRTLPPVITELRPKLNINKINTLTPRYGMGGAREVLLSPQQSVRARAEALLALSKKASPLTNLLVNQLLPDNEDAIRLLAFSLLNEQERKIASQISKSIEKLETTTNNVNKGRLQKNIALLYWEIIYRKLLTKELQNFVLTQALNYTKEALENLPDDPEVYTLLGRIYSSQNKYDEAEEAFIKALQLNVAKSHVIPYLAEIDFHRKRFNKVKTLFFDNQELNELPTIGKVAEFWMKS